jgi:DUF4097 and DUF4098 domain-containing protein YvlB
MGGEIALPEAPHGADLETMGGAIRVGSAAGHVRAVTMGGDVSIERLDGSVDALSMAGDVRVTIVGDGGADGRDVRLESYSGTLTLVVPESLDAQIQVQLAYTRSSARSYRIESDIPLETTITSTWDTSEGSPRKFIHGKGRAGSGKNRIVLRTINGDVRIKRAAGAQRGSRAASALERSGTITGRASGGSVVVALVSRTRKRSLAGS